MKRFNLMFVICLFFISCKKDGPSAPQLNTLSAVVDKTNNSVLMTGSVTNEGGSAVKERGFCWSTSPSPSISDAHASNAYGIGQYTYQLTNLALSTTYYVRAYATNSIGTSYGNEISFKSLTLGKVTTSAPTDITNISAKSTITIDDFGDATILKIGAICSTKQNALLVNDSTAYFNANNTDKNFSITFNNLQQNTLYYIRGFVQSGAGVGYGNEVTFTTNGVPTLTSTSATSITQTSALISGNLTNNGGDLITEIGVCLSKNQNPTVNDMIFKSTNLNMNMFSANSSGLVGNTLYYVRAYAKNKYGIGYGPQSSFKSAPVLATISTSTFNPASIYSTKASYGATITDDGGAAVIEIGLVASLKSNPTISNTVFSSNSISNTFSIQMTGLTNDTIYYVKPYVKNSVGITYGNEVSFRTGYKVGVENGPAGGIVIYAKPIKTNGWRWIEAAPTDVKDSVFMVRNSNYSCLNGLSNSLGLDYGDGLNNSTILINNCGNESLAAAQSATNYTYNNFTDWYLPSRNEMLAMCNILGLGSPITLKSGWIYFSSSLGLLSDGSTFYYSYNIPINTASGYYGETKSTNGFWGKVRAVRKF
jgi:hypothetical protein